MDRNRGFGDLGLAISMALRIQIPGDLRLVFLALFV